MEDAKVVLRMFVDSQGWNETTQLGLLLEFINDQCLDNKLHTFLEKIVEEQEEEEEEAECSMCCDTYVVVNCAGHRRPCDYCDHDQWELPGE